MNHFHIDNMVFTLNHESYTVVHIQASQNFVSENKNRIVISSSHTRACCGIGKHSGSFSHHGDIHTRTAIVRRSTDRGSQSLSDVEQHGFNRCRGSNQKLYSIIITVCISVI